MTTGQVPVDLTSAGWPTVPARGRERDVYYCPRPPWRRDRRRLRRTHPGRQPDGHGRLRPVCPSDGRSGAQGRRSPGLQRKRRRGSGLGGAGLRRVSRLPGLSRRRPAPHFRGRRGSIAAGTGIVSGAVMVAVKLGSAAPIMALWADHSTISPQLALVLNDLGGVAFVISWLPFAIFVAAAAAALHRAGLVGRPTAYCGFVLGAAGLVLTIIGIHDPLQRQPAGVPAWPAVAARRECPSGYQAGYWRQCRQGEREGRCPRRGQRLAPHAVT